jgi:hypothetical protein
MVSTSRMSQGQPGLVTAFGLGFALFEDTNLSLTSYSVAKGRAPRRWDR